MIPTPLGFVEFFDLKIIVRKTTDHPLFYDHWKVFKYEFLQWIFVKDEKRKS